LILATFIFPANAQLPHAGRGAISAKDLAKIEMQAISGSDSADSGTGRVSLAVNTTPSHALSSSLGRPTGWFTAGSGASLAGLVFLFLPRRKLRSGALLAVAFIALVFTILGCGSATKLDPGTAKGSYSVVVTGTAGSGSTEYQASTNVSITIE
jgi:hypothetical protein